MINITLFDVKFYSWSSYGAYLGNYHDSKNDFSKRNTINFTAGAQMEKSNNKRIIFTNGEECYACGGGGYQPPVAYYGSQCSQIKKELTVEDFVDNHQVIKILK